jgi:hypothetical protein
MKANKTTRGQATSNHRRRKDKQSESGSYSIVHNQIRKQQLSGMNSHLLININTERQQTQLPHRKTPFGKLD